jgi:tRNA(Ile2) C34 agmatinyltransferase TiaS
VHFLHDCPCVQKTIKKWVREQKEAYSKMLDENEAPPEFVLVEVAEKLHVLHKGVIRLPEGTVERMLSKRDELVFSNVA